MECRRRIATKLVATLALVVAAQISVGCRSQKQRCVFIDGGAHLGESYTTFAKTKLYHDYTWDIYAIEVNPQLIERLPRVPRLTVLNKAMWDSEGTLEFHIQPQTTGGSVVRNWEGSETMKVPAFDFSQWVKSNFAVEDYVILSIDIEGAEFKVLDKMVKDDTIKYLDRLYVEFHPGILKKEGRPQEEVLEWENRLITLIGRHRLILVQDSVDDAVRQGHWCEYLL